MLENLIGNFLAKFVGKRLDGYKTKIGIVCGIVALGLAAVGKIFPDLGLAGADQDWSVIIQNVVKLVQDYSALGAAVLIPIGVASKAYKAGLSTPVPQSTTPQPAPASTAPTAAIQSGVIEQDIPGPPAGSGGFGPQGN